MGSPGLGKRKNGCDEDDKPHGHQGHARDPSHVCTLSDDSGLAKRDKDVALDEMGAPSPRRSKPGAPCPSKESAFLFGHWDVIEFRETEIRVRVWDHDYLPHIVGLVGTIASLLAAALWLYSALIDVPNNIDTIVGELQRIARWNAYAAWAACVGALCAAYGFVRSTLT
jgi:hypothetical protein